MLLSLCMIVKNEEKVLPRCLDSVQGLVDEIIIVDTGSTDRTKEIARSYTDKVFDFEWTNNFAEARNESLRHATGDWILVLDADEYVQAEGKEELRAFLARSKPNNVVYMLPILNIVGTVGNHRFIESLSSRLFPNHRGIYFTRPIHEQLTADHFDLIREKFNFYIYHTGYTEETVSDKQKSERNMEIFNKLVGTSSMDPYYYFCLGNEYRNKEEYKKALYYYEKAHRKGNPAYPWFAHCLEAMISIQLNARNITDAYTLILEGVNSYPNHPDFLCLQGAVLHYFGFHRQAIQIFESCIRLADQLADQQQSVCLVSPDYAYTTPFEKLTDIYAKRLDHQKMVYYLAKQLRANPTNVQPAVKLALLLSRTESTDALKGFFEKLLPSDGNPGNCHLLFRIFLTVGHLDLAMHYYEHCLNQHVDLRPIDCCRYALLSKNKSLFQEAYSQLTAEERQSPDASRYGRIAGILWENRSLDDLLAGDKGDSSDIVRFLADLFDLQYYELFDQVIAQVQSPAIIESVAGHFFSIGEWNLALSYYEFLEESGSLNATAYEQLYYIYLQQGSKEKSLYCIRKAIDIEPDIPRRYGLLFEQSDPHDIVKYKKVFVDTFPEYRKLPFIANL